MVAFMYEHKMNNLWVVLITVLIINFVASIGVSLFITGNGVENMPFKNTCCFIRANFPYLADTAAEISPGGLAPRCEKECRMFYQCPHLISECTDFNGDPDCCAAAVSLTKVGISSSRCIYDEYTLLCGRSPPSK